MLDKYIAILKAKKLYEVAMGLVIFVVFFIVNKIFTLPIFMLPFLVFMGVRIFLKTRIKQENQPLVTGLALQFSQYLMILIAAFTNPFAKLIDIFVIFWGSNWLWKTPNWRSGGLMIGYNIYLIFGYTLGLMKSIPAHNLTQTRYAGLFILTSLASIYFIYDGVKIILANKKADQEIETATIEPTQEAAQPDLEQENQE